MYLEQRVASHADVLREPVEAGGDQRVPPAAQLGARVATQRHTSHANARDM
jgi:hypothetical protein